MRDIIGVDVSKDTPGTYSPAGEVHRQFVNDPRGIARPVKWAGNIGGTLTASVPAEHPSTRSTRVRRAGSPKPPGDSPKPTALMPGCRPGREPSWACFSTICCDLSGATHHMW